jgi:hypothetical protein
MLTRDKLKAKTNKNNTCITRKKQDSPFLIARRQTLTCYERRHGSLFHVGYVPPPSSGNRRLNPLKHEERQINRDGAERGRVESGERCETRFYGETHTLFVLGDPCPLLLLVKAGWKEDRTSGSEEVNTMGCGVCCEQKKDLNLGPYCVRLECLY